MDQELPYVVDVLWVGCPPSGAFPETAAIHAIAGLDVALSRQHRLRHDLVVVPECEAWDWALVPGEAPLPSYGHDEIGRLAEWVAAVVGTWQTQSDPDLESLRPGYLARLSQRLVALERAMGAQDFALLGQISHQISGTAALYGLRSVGWESAGLFRAARASDVEASQWHLRRLRRGASWAVALG